MAEALPLRSASARKPFRSVLRFWRAMNLRQAPCTASSCAPSARDTALTRAFTGRLARGIRNRFIDDMRKHETALAPYPVQAWLTAQLKQAAIAQGRADLCRCGRAKAQLDSAPQGG